MRLIQQKAHQAPLMHVYKIQNNTRKTHLACAQNGEAQQQQQQQKDDGHETREGEEDRVVRREPVSEQEGRCWMGRGAACE